MNYLEQHLKRIGDYPLNEKEIYERTQEVCQEIRNSWNQYKIYRQNMHDEEIEDNPLIMFIVWLIRKGVI